MNDKEQKATYEKFYRAARPLVFAILRREDDELAWEIATKGLMELESFKEESEMLTWFNTLARNSCLDQLKMEKRRRETSIETLGREEFSQLAVENEALGQIEWEELRFLRGERELAELVKEGFGWEEIGWKLGIGKDTAKKRWQRVVERLRRERGESL